MQMEVIRMNNIWTVVLATEAGPPPHIRLAEGQVVAVLPRHMPYPFCKWMASEAILRQSPCPDHQLCTRDCRPGCGA